MILVFCFAFDAWGKKSKTGKQNDLEQLTTFQWGYFIAVRK